MSKTDKDRPNGIRCDDTYAKGRYIEHRRWLGSCDYHPRNNTILHQRRFDPRFRTGCSGRLQWPRYDSYRSRKRDRVMIERRFRRACRKALRNAVLADVVDDSAIFLPHPSYYCGMKVL
ncbi:MAG: hypothetical protein PVI21_01015 [Candidatus Woesebacteria bacterium]|jgi:hypothetical protein